MKDISEIVCAVIDYGTFTDLAVTMSKTVATTLYHTPIQREYLNCHDCCLGDGVEGITRVDEPMHPDIVEMVDLWIFPDIGFSGMQQYLRSIGKAVWGSMGCDDLELYRTRFIDFVGRAGLPVAPHKKIRGLTNLAEYLKDETDKWVKVNRYRDNMETWRHVNYECSIPKLNELAMQFGACAEHVVFVVQDQIDTSIEIGYDGWNVFGQFPESSFQGYEKKNELYLGSQCKYEQLPEAVKAVNSALAPMLEERQYANFIATEIRWVSEEEFYFIDPTMRMPGQTGEQLLETCANLPEVIWKGANGELVKPEWNAKYAAEATVHLDGKGENFGVLKVPDSLERWFKPGHYFVADGLHKFPGGKNDECGIIMGMADTIEESIEQLQGHFEEFDGQPVSIRTEGFVDLLKAVHEAEGEGVEFSDEKIPEPLIVLEDK